MRQFKIIGEHTPKHSAPSMCNSCRWSHIIKGHRDQITICEHHGNAVRIDFVVTSCNEYDDRTQPTLYEMEKIAWRFSVDRASKRAGFLNPKEFKKKHPDDE